MVERIRLSRAVTQKLAELCKEGGEIDSSTLVDRWCTRVHAFLLAAIGREEADRFIGLYRIDPWDRLNQRLGQIEGLLATSQTERLSAEGSLEMSPGPEVEASRNIFVVHGHDNEAKEATARFITRLGLSPVILHEQSNGGRTIIEKFEIHSGSATFAVVLLTPDDVGAAKTSDASSRPRARQNVVLEFGYFMGRLGRSRVCALYKGGVELPSDIHGVVYIEMDSAGAWKPKLAQEFVAAKIAIDWTGVIG